MAARFNQTRNAAGPFYPAIQILEKQESTDAAIVIRMSSNSNIQTTWLIQKGKASPLNPEEQSTFDNALKTLVESPEFQRFEFQLEILTQADAAKFTEAIRN